MAQSTDFEAKSVPQTARPGKEGAAESAGRKFKRFCARSVLWTYPRGSWQYDVLCLLILLFIFLPSHSFFQDGPQLELTDLRHRQGFVEMGRTKDGRTYQIDARLVESLEGLPPEDAIREVLRQRLKGAVTVKSIIKIVGKDNVVLGYTVTVANPAAKDTGGTP
ncbi:MAG: hypothetical protein ACLQOO_22515 [Terriglobia bacterium]